MNALAQQAPTTVLEVRNVSVRYGGIRALDGVDLTIREGEFRGIIGPNGAGKTTLFNAITGVVRPAEGSIRFVGEDLVGKPPELIRRKGISRTYQKVRPFTRLSVLENVSVPIVNQDDWSGSMLEARNVALELIAKVGLEQYAHTEAGSLNLYHRKKVELARALAGGGKLLLLDEVMAGLTPVECDAAVDLLRALKQEYRFTVICIEHLMRIVMAISDTITVLDRGKIIAEGSPQEVSANERVKTAYFGGDDA